MKVPEKYLSRAEEITQTFIEKVHQHIEDIVEGRVDNMWHIKDFAAAMYIHPVHLSNTIKTYSQKAPCYFFEHRLMEVSRDLLLQPELTIADIAYKLTFDTSNFTKFFKRFEGVTPSEFRKRSGVSTRSMAAGSAMQGTIAGSAMSATTAGTSMRATATTAA
jgi:AraC-like DNA-binding protein